MTTPNIEELIAYLRGFFIDENVTAVKANQIADLLQSQAERIKELEAEVEMWKQSAIKMGEHEANACIENEALRKANLDCVDHYNDCRAEAEALRIQVAELGKDAERYRWLCDYMISSATVYDDSIVAADSSVAFDRVVDTALANAKGAK